MRGLWVLLLVLAMVACGRGGSVPPTPETGPRSAFDLMVGVCYDDPADPELVEQVAVVPCSALHDNEVFHVVDYPADASAAYPDDLAAFAEGECVAAFERYVGRPYDESSLFLAPLLPTPESWASGDREVVCVLFAAEDGVTVPIEGSRRDSQE